MPYQVARRGFLSAALLAAGIALIPFSQFLWNPWALYAFFIAALALALASLPHTVLHILDGWDSVFFLVAFIFVSSRFNPSEPLRLKALEVVCAAILFGTARSLQGTQRIFVQRVLATTSGTYCVLFILSRLSPAVSGNIQTTEFFLNQNVAASFALLGGFCAFSIGPAAPLLGWALFMSCALALALSKSAAAFLGAAAGLGWLLRTQLKRAWWLAGIVVAMGATVAVGLLNPSSVIDRARWQKAALLLTVQNPWTGIGPGSYETASAPILAGTGLRSRFAHSFAFQWSAELGAGITLLLLVFFTRQWLRQEDRVWAAGLLAVFVHNLADFALNVPGFFALYWAALGLGQARIHPPLRLPAPKMITALWILAVPVLGWTGWRWGVKPLMAIQSTIASQTALDAGNKDAALSHLKRSIELDPLPEKPRRDLEALQRANPTP